jgi:hypothetical protein
MLTLDIYAQMQVKIRQCSSRGGELEAIELGSEGGCGLDAWGFEVVVHMSRDAVEGEAKQGGDVAVGHGASMATSTGAIGLCDGGTSTLAGRKAAATLLTLGVVRALDEDRLLGLLAGCELPSDELGRGSSLYANSGDCERDGSAMDEMGKERGATAHRGKQRQEQRRTSWSDLGRRVVTSESLRE